MTTLIEFLLARIAEDEDSAHRATAGPWRAVQTFDGIEGARTWDIEARLSPDWAERVPVLIAEPLGSEEDWQHIARNNPSRVLAECEAKRRIVDEVSFLRSLGLVSPNTIIEYLALPYADHPDYDESWRP